MDVPENHFKWFGEGFDGFPKTLPEDCIEYTIYILDSRLTDIETREQLRQVQSAGIKLTNELLKDFIWQRESFKLSIERDNNGKSSLRGRTNYGDSVEDEWLIVYMLRELSRQYPKIWIRIVDTDGQFLLIEAANVLPRWLNPEIADFRVWLNSGKLLIIPLEKPDEQVIDSKSGPLTRNEALEFLENQWSKLLHLPAVEAEAFYRLSKYPKQVSDSLHYALLTIPRKLAYVLREDAAYISAAVEAFYLRDPIALRPLQASHHAGLHFPPTDLVAMSVKFTKVGYAQLKSQQFAAPGPWADYASATGESTTQGRAEMGMKTTCGFEMLMCDPQNQDKKAVREIAMLLEDIHTGQDDLPNDAEIKNWENREDDEAWLDINFEDFEKELEGGRKPGAPVSNEGFGDRGAQENLRKMVTRFEEFLNDDAAGADGAELLDEMDKDNDEEEDSNEEAHSTISDDSDDDEDEDTDVSFDEEAFSKMMREMMGMPPVAGIPKTTTKVNPHEDEVVSSISPDEGDDNGVHRAMQDIETELQEAGALNLNPKQEANSADSKRKAVEKGSSRGQVRRGAKTEEASEDEDADVDFNLAKNLLESFKSQGGRSGPGGNMMNFMGMRLPRDENDAEGY